MLVRIIGTIFLFVIFLICHLSFNSSIQPRLASDISLSQMERKDNSAEAMRAYQLVTNYYRFGVNGFIGLCVLGIWYSPLKKEVLKMKNFLLPLLLLPLFLTGCAYDTPVYVQIETSETPFLIKLEGDNDQVTMQSEQYLKEQMVATKRIGVSYRWISLGYMPLDGKYIPNERIIVVDRAPETREWSDQNTDSHSGGLWMESKDSVGFTTGISITARIDDTDHAVKFLYNYPPRKERQITAGSGMYKDPFVVSISDLADVMDREVRTKIQESFSEKASKHNMDELREIKNEVVKSVKDEVIAFFDARGITITAMGTFGGFTYKNPESQKAIDRVFQAQQDKEVAIAESEAAQERKTALKLQGEGLAAKILESKRGEAEAIKLVADAKAYEVQKVTTEPATYLELRRLDIENKRIDKWSGNYPQIMTGEGGGLLLNMPQPTK
jgi:autonomous glycyl radical cofactor GrcA